MRGVALSVLVGALIAAVPAAGQDVNRGDRVRITALGLPGRRTATVLRSGADTLVLRLGRGVRRLSWWDVRTLERSIARTGRRAMARGALVGTAIGLVYGIYALATYECVDLGCAVAPPLLFTFGLAGGMLAGAGVGFVVGALAPSDVWRAVPGYEPWRGVRLALRIPIRM